MANILYILASLCWVLLLSPYPVTVFMAGCAACVSYPLFTRIQARVPGWRGTALYGTILCLALVIPVTVLVLLVVPQAAAGLHMLQKLRESNFQIPQTWLDQWNSAKAWASDLVPGLDSSLDELFSSLYTYIGKGVSTIVSGSLGFVGGTMTAFWVVFLFLTLAIFATIYAERLHRLTLALTHMPAPMLARFVQAVRGALRGVLLGVVLVALAQGVLCGVGFAVAGVKQPAFWGMLACLVAPIPLVGTALVWVPLAIMLWFTGETLAAVGLCIWGTLAVAGIDNLLRPLFLRQGINAPIFILVLAILCGIATFGPVGLIAGPVLVAFGIQAIHEADALTPIGDAAPGDDAAPGEEREGGRP